MYNELLKHNMFSAMPKFAYNPFTLRGHMREVQTPLRDRLLQLRADFARSGSRTDPFSGAVFENWHQELLPGRTWEMCVEMFDDARCGEKALLTTCVEFAVLLCELSSEAACAAAVLLVAELQPVRLNLRWQSESMYATTTLGAGDEEAAANQTAWEHGFAGVDTSISPLYIFIQMSAAGGRGGGVSGIIRSRLGDTGNSHARAVLKSLMCRLSMLASRGHLGRHDRVPG